MIFPSKKYSIIYADPPWTFKNWSKKGEDKNATQHYSCMNIEDIYNLPVESIAEDDCVLFLWVTYPLLKEGLQTIQRWGFTYKTCAFSWVKRNKNKNSFFWGLGYWTRSNNEICLLATKGKPKRVSSSVHQIIYEPITRHSEKPQCVRYHIVKLCGNVPRIELFARNVIGSGWDSWGNETLT